MAIEIVDLSIKKGDFPQLCKRLPEGMFLVYTKSNALSYGYKWSLFWGGLSLDPWLGVSGHNWTLPY